MLDSFPISASVLAAAGVLLVVLRVALIFVLGEPRASKTSSLPLPPGPRGLPLLGNALDIPLEHNWLKFSEWAEQYGDVVHLSALGKHIVVLNSYQAVADLLLKRGANYSDRPVLPMANLSGFGTAWGLLQYGDRLRAMRRLSAQVLGPREIRNFEPMQNDFVLQFLRKVDACPELLRENAHWLIARYILKIVYNHDVEDAIHDPLVRLNESASLAFTKSASPKWIVNAIPAIQHLPEWLPGMSFLQRAREWRIIASSLNDVPFAIVKGAMERGMAQPESHSIVARLLTNEGKGVTALEEDIIRYTAGAQYGGAGETAVSAIRIFYLAMTLHPDIQARAQAEIEALTGGERLVTVEDRPALPFVDALVKEVHRFHPALPAGLPHCTREEDEYRGWKLPAETIVMTNIWHLSRDPAVYPDPHCFKPERYLATSPITPGMNPDPRTFVFGFGRRDCPGRHLADALLWHVIANSLASFNIHPATSPDGGIIVNQLRFTGGTISHPEDFSYSLEPQSDRATAWLRA